LFLLIPQFVEGSPQPKLSRCHPLTKLDQGHAELLSDNKLKD